VSLKKIKHMGGREKSVPAFIEGQNCDAAASFFITREQFEEGKASGEIRPINRGKAALVKRYVVSAGERILPNVKIGWSVVHQTPRNGAPGNPSFQLV
jgi:hypothetical protein